MVRISAVFIALCMVLIAGSAGAVLYLRFGLTGAEAALVALGVLTALAVYNTIAARTRDRKEASDQLALLSRSAGDLARQMAEFGRRLSVIEDRAEQVLERALANSQPLASELEELSTLVKQLADSRRHARSGARGRCREDAIRTGGHRGRCGRHACERRRRRGHV